MLSTTSDIMPIMSGKLENYTFTNFYQLLQVLRSEEDSMH